MINNKKNKDMTTYNNNCVGCGCGPAIPEPCITPPPLCHDPQPCTEIINAECVIYTGPAITCNFSPVIPANSSIAEALDSIVEYLCFGRCCVIPLTPTIDQPDHIVLCTDETATCTYEGKLYNWYALNAGTQGDGRVAGGIVNTNVLDNPVNTWRVPNNNDWYSLILALDPTASINTPWANTAGGALKTTTCWSRPNTGATDSSGLSISAGVKRLYNTGLFTLNNGQEAWYWSTGITANAGIYEFILSYTTAMLGYFYSGSALYKRDGIRVRLVRPVDCNSSEKDGDFIPNAYTDNTGTQYNGQVLGTLVWLTTDLTDITYNNGLSIPNIVFDAPWIAATAGAWCYPNNDDEFTITYSIGCVERKITFRDFLTFLPTASETFIVVAAAGIQVNSVVVGSQTTYTVTNIDTGSAQNIFKNIAVAGESTIIADTNNDTLTVVSGTGINVTTNAGTDTLTITNTDLGSSVTLSDAGTDTHHSLVNDATGPTLATKGLKAGTGITISSTANNITITSDSTNIGKLLGGGIVVAEWNESGVKKALIASLTDLSVAIEWTIPAFQTTLIGATAQSFYDGLTNSNAIVAQTLVPAANTYAAGIARLFADGGYSDWYLPSAFELNMCYNSAGIVNKILGSNGFNLVQYWNSTESTSISAKANIFTNNSQSSLNKNSLAYVRAVRIHNL